MSTIFSYNANAKYLTKYLKGVYNNINFSLLDIYLKEKGPSLKIHHIVTKPSTTAVDYDKWPLSDAF